MHEERQKNAFPAGLVPHRVGIRSVAQKGIAIQRDPLASILKFMSGEPLLLGIAMVNCFQRRQVRDRHVDALLLNEGKRFKRTQQPVLEYRFQFMHHDLIVAEGSARSRRVRLRTPLRRITLFALAGFSYALQLAAFLAEWTDGLKDEDALVLALPAGNANA
jgi:hypothetical protein